MTPQSGRTGCLVEKNRLVAADAQDVEEAFQARLATFATHAADAVQQTPAASEQLPIPLSPTRFASRKKDPTTRRSDHTLY